MKQKNFIPILLIILILSSGYIYHQHKKLFPIDMVYLWVDGSDEKWATKKNYWQKQMGINNPYAVHPARWRDREELKHSLRSVEKYMPWINKIYIVTDNQIPKWLNIKHPKIRIIDHSEILPHDALPIFNSTAIETGIANIKGLSEHFIYANDDVFANKPLSRNFFFTPDGTPIFYNNKIMAMEYKHLYKKEKQKRTMWAKMLENDQKTIEQKLGKHFQFLEIVGTHTFTSYNKSTYKEAMNLFDKEIKKTAHSKFRSEGDLSRDIVFNYAWKHRRVILADSRNVKQFKCKNAGILIMNNVEDIETKQPCAFCLNDYQNISENTLNKHAEILHKLFPNKSSFEK
jgi:hypothetical protein